MRIALLASESNPFCKSGGLADVIFSLGKEFVRAGNETIIILPFYENMLGSVEEVTPVMSFDVYLSWRKHHAKVWKTSAANVPFYLIDSDYYFGRDNLYGYMDDGERFAFFCLAAKKLLENLQFKPDIIQCNDWQTAIIPTLIKADPNSSLSKAKTVLTIHNPAFAGLLNFDAIGDLFNLSLPHDLLRKSSIYGMCSTLLLGIHQADMVTTVSPTHAEELRSGNAYNIGNALLEKGKNFRGVVNGVDYEEFNASKDRFIEEHFSLKTLASGKKACKTALFHACGAEVNDGPLFVLVSRLYEQKGIPLVLSVAPHIVEKGGNLFVLGSGDFSYCNALSDLARTYPGRVGVYLGYNQRISHQSYAAGDFFLMPSLFEPCGISQMIAQRYACIPVARATGGLIDTIRDHKDGILFNDYDEGGIRYGVDEAFAIYHDQARFEAMRKACLKKDHSWGRSASSYLKIFTQLLS